MVNVTITVPEELKEEMEKHRGINWSEVARRAFEERLKHEEMTKALAGIRKLRSEAPSKGWSGEKEVRRWRDAHR